VWALQALVLVLVCVGVGRTVQGALAQLSQHSWSVRPTWLMVAGMFYAAGLTPMAWFWYRALSSLGQPAPWWETLRAYYLGHLGKYVPGKALTVVLRVAAVRPWVTSIRIGVLSMMLETLTMMAVGASLAAALSLVVLQLEPRLAVIAVAMAAAAGFPTLPPVAKRVARIGLARIKQDSDLSLPPSISSDVSASLHGINLRLLAAGWLAGTLCWVLLGLSLWATLRSIGVEQIHLLSRDLASLIAAVAVAVVAGFLSMLPGGLVVRDAVLMQLLVPLCGDEASALVAAVLLRLVWLVTEVLVCGILYMVASRLRFSAKPQASSDTETLP
jgi:uncharacterized membrane protein YbhN (UPF0104 family)